MISLMIKRHDWSILSLTVQLLCNIFLIFPSTAIQNWISTSIDSFVQICFALINSMVPGRVIRIRKTTECFFKKSFICLLSPEFVLIKPVSTSKHMILYLFDDWMNLKKWKCGTCKVYSMYPISCYMFFARAKISSDVLL